MKLQSDYDKKMVLLEISALQAMGKSNYVPRLYGCVTKPTSTMLPARNQNFGTQAKQSPTMVYVAQEILHSDLDNTFFKAHVQTKLDVNQSYKLWIQMFQGLKDLWTVGLVHNDIKPANMMTNKDYSRIYLIDLGLTSMSDANVIHGGSPVFMSPPKFDSRAIKVSQKDDFYSVALSIADIEAKTTMEIFSKDQNNRPVSNTCWSKSNTKVCRAAFAFNVAKILSGAGYGANDQTKKDISTINFTTLMVEMIKYDAFNFSVDEVIAIIYRLSGGVQQQYRQQEMVSKRIMTQQEQRDLETKKAQIELLDQQHKQIVEQKKVIYNDRYRNQIEANHQQKQLLANQVYNKIKPGAFGDLINKNKGNLRDNMDGVNDDDIMINELETKENEIYEMKKDITRGHLQQDEFYMQQRNAFQRIANRRDDLDVIIETYKDNEEQIIDLGRRGINRFAPLQMIEETKEQDFRGLYDPVNAYQNKLKMNQFGQERTDKLGQGGNYYHNKIIGAIVPNGYKIEAQRQELPRIEQKLAPSNKLPNYGVQVQRQESMFA